MISRKYRLLPGIAISLFIGFGVFILFERPNDESSGDILSLPLEIQWRAGASQQYDVLTDTSIKLNVSGMPALQNISTHLTGILELNTLDVEPSNVLVGMRLISVEMLVNGISKPDINLALMHPFRVRFATSGLPASFEFPAVVATEHRDLLENLIRTFQVVVKKGDAWLAEESNSSGVYEAAYVRSTSSSIEKTKQRFIRLSSVMAKARSEISSKELFRIDANQDWVSAMEVDETIKIDDPEGFSVDATNHATLELRSAHAATSKDVWSFVEAAPLPDLARRTPTLSLAEAEKQLRDNLIALDAATEGRGVLIHRLRDLILIDESLPFALLKAMKTQELTDRTRSDLYLVLELAGSSQAQIALTSVISDASWSPLDAMRAIVALGAVKEPTDETISALWSAAHSGPTSDDRSQIAGTAALALGSIGKSLRVEDDVNYAQLRAYLLDGAMSAPDTHQRAVFLHALGNTADSDPSLTRDIVSFLNDSDPEIRGASAKTIGRLGANEVADQLMQQLEQEDNSDVRGSLAEALMSWDHPSAPAMAKVRSMILVESDENARLNMARVLGENMKTFPDNKKPLQELLRTDKSKRIRQYIAEVFVAAR